MKILVTSGLGLSEAHLEELRVAGRCDGKKAEILECDDRYPLTSEALQVDIVVGTGFLRWHSVDQFSNLKFVQFTSAGLDEVPLEDLDKRGIPYASARSIYTQPMTEWALLQILRFYKRADFFDDNQKVGKWEKRRDLLELSGKTATIIGYGSVGESLGNLLAVLGVTVLAVSRSPKEVLLPGRHVPLDQIKEALSISDIVVMSIAHTPDTHHLMNAERLNAMKPGSVLLNLSRGGTIDTGALIEAIGRGHFCGVALDVFEEEPLPANSPLWWLPEVVITPHISFASDRTQERMFQLVLANVRRISQTSDD